MTKVLTEMDGLSWREKLPPIPTVPMEVKEKLLQASAPAQAPAPNTQQNGIKENDKPGIYGHLSGLSHVSCFLTVSFLFP